MIWFPTGELKQGEFVIEFEHKQMIVSEMNHRDWFLSAFDHVV